MGLLDSIDAEKEFPLRVHYPAGGWLRLLIWYAEHEGQHLIAGSGEKQVLQAFSARLKKENGDAKPVAYWDAKLVCPPACVREASSKASLQQDFEHFVSGIGWKLKTAFEKNPEAFPNLSKCQKRRRGDKEHWNCPACLHSIAVEGHTRESFYLAKRSPPPAEVAPQDMPRRRGMSPVARPSRAPEWDPSLPLYVVTADFGHHCKGINIKEVDLKGEYLGQYGNSAMFFFQGTELAIPGAALRMLKQYDDKHAAAEEERKVAFRKERDEREQKELEELKRLVS